MSRDEKNRMKAEDLNYIYDKLWSQLQEDREFVVQQYKNLKEHFKEDPNRLNINGDILVKSSDDKSKTSNEDKPNEKSKHHFVY